MRSVRAKFMCGVVVLGLLAVVQVLHAACPDSRCMKPGGANVCCYYKTTCQQSTCWGGYCIDPVTGQVGVLICAVQSD